MPQHDPVVHTFQGGLNEALFRDSIADDEVSSCANFIPNRDNSTGSGGILKREGITRVSSVQTEAWTSISQGKNATYGTTSTAIRNSAGTSLQAITSSTDPDWATMLNNDIMVDGVNAPQTSTNGTTFAALGGTPPTFKYIEAHANFLFGAGHSDGLLRWADVGTVATWTATNALTITNQQNDAITGLKKFRDVLICFTNNNFFHVNGTTTTDMSITYKKYGIGCTSHRSIVVVGDEIFWWSNLGLVRSNGFDATYICLPSQGSSGSLRGIPITLANLNKARYTLVHGCWNEQQERVEFYVCNGAAQTTVNLAIYYYYKTDTFWLASGLGAQMGASGCVLNSGVPDVYVGSAGTSDSYIFKQDKSTILDDTTTITATIATGSDNAGGFTAVKRPKRLTTTILGAAAASTVTYSTITKDRDGTNVTTNFTLSPTAGITTHNRSYLNRTYYSLRHQISEAMATGTRPVIMQISNEGFVMDTR